MSELRIDIVTVRDPDHSNAYAFFVNGAREDEGSNSGVYVDRDGFHEGVRIEVWDIDLGAHDLSDPRVWDEWTYSDPTTLGAPAGVLDYLVDTIAEAALKFGHDYSLVRFNHEWPTKYVCEVPGCYAPAKYKAPAGEYYCAVHGETYWELAPNKEEN